jgi:hypothetical protein
MPVTDYNIMLCWFENVYILFQNYKPPIATIILYITYMCTYFILKKTDYVKPSTYVLEDNIIVIKVHTSYLSFHQKENTMVQFPL